jgi:hypothetical protein
MNYVLDIAFALAGGSILIWNKPISDKFGAFYAHRYSATFRKLAQFLRLDDPNTRLNRFMYRGFVITTGIILILFSIGAFLGTNFVGPSAEQPNTILEYQ